MGPQSYMRSDADRNVVMRRVALHRMSYKNWTLRCISAVDSLNFPANVCGCLLWSFKKKKKNPLNNVRCATLATQ